MSIISDVQPDEGRIRANLPESVMTAVGFLNPVMSRILNRDRPGMQAPETVSYGRGHRFGDIYGDLIYTARKKAGFQPPAAGRTGR